ncbi:BA14K family protein [Bradyrhizobium roseum]|uniref:BA14K family protein n=1 Tax=Bradyrhizobium roseum TaxID=3056648 RepID=UPI0026187FC0|nr:BA14K family protein [Bradyrhizobium roseus]WKA27627.1 BA14K family protein [Bradyrhizobium roseus]
MTSWKIVAVTILLGASATISPAAAAPMAPVAGPEMLAASAFPLTSVQYRRWHHGNRRWHHRRHYGPGAAALGGLAAGAVIGGAIANSQARANDAMTYCAQRYRSYDPASGTYLGYDGNRHSCP